MFEDNLLGVRWDEAFIRIWYERDAMTTETDSSQPAALPAALVAEAIAGLVFGAVMAVIAGISSVGLYAVLPDKKHYVLMQGQSWHNQGQTLHDPLIPDIFDVAYYIDKAKQGDYRRYLVKS
jgi:hypothetical protein